MARIRTIKPEFWVSRQVISCSHSARLLFIGLWNFSDDRGVHRDDPVRLKAEIFPVDSCSLLDIEAWVRELTRAGLIRRFEVNGAAYLHVTGFKKHQQIQHPQKRWAYPDPDEFNEDSMSAQGALTLESSRIERKGREGSRVDAREERRGAANGHAAAALPDVHPLFAATQAKIEAQFNSPTLTDFGQIDRWLKAGAVPELDIYPTLNALTARRREQDPRWLPRSLRYFNEAIAEAIAARSAALPTSASNGLRRGVSGAEVEAILAKFETGKEA